MSDHHIFLLIEAAAVPGTLVQGFRVPSPCRGKEWSEAEHRAAAEAEAEAAAAAEGEEQISTAIHLTIRAL
jgi:hypothetical protein